MHKRNNYKDENLVYSVDKKLKKWLNKYWNDYKFEVFNYFDEADLGSLKKLNICVSNKLYSERELERFEMQLLRYYNKEELLKKRFVSYAEYEKILQIIQKVINDNGL